MKPMLLLFDLCSEWCPRNICLQREIFAYRLKLFQRIGDTSQREKVLVCPPDPHNITLIFIPLSKFLEEIEDAMNCLPG